MKMEKIMKVEKIDKIIKGNLPEVQNMLLTKKEDCLLHKAMKKDALKL